MISRPSLSALTLVLVAAPACLLPPEEIGETLTLGHHDSHGSATDPPGSAITGTTEAPDNPNPLLYGEPCELIGDSQEETADPPDEELQPVNTALGVNERCASGMCLLTYDDPLPVHCETDADCGTPEAVCADAGHCMLAPAYVADHTRCTQACETAADCPDIPGCETGVSCGIARGFGPNCCAPVCACNDRLSVSRSEELAARCAYEPVCQ